MQIAMLLNAECDIELLRFQIRFHSDAGIVKFLLWSARKQQGFFRSGARSGESVSTHSGFRHSALQGFVPSGSEVLHCELPESVASDNQRLAWLGQLCSTEGYADWFIDNRGADFWLADGELSEQLVAMASGSSDLSQDPYWFQAHIMAADPGSEFSATASSKDPAKPESGRAIDLQAHFTDAIYQLPCISDSVAGAAPIQRCIRPARSLAVTTDVPKNDSTDSAATPSTATPPITTSAITTQDTVGGASCPITVLHYPLLSAVSSEGIVADTANVRVNPCISIYYSMCQSEGLQSAQSAA